MIFYFSGTGNSEWVAETIAKRISDTCVRVTEDTMKPVTIHKNEVLGLVFPVYAWNMPQMISEFLKGIVIEEGAYTFAVCTCGEEAGYAMHLLKGRIHLDNVWSLTMPDNYIVAYKVEDEETSLSKVRTSALRLRVIGDQIAERKKGTFDVHKGKFALVKTFVVSHFFNKYARSSKPFHSTYDCAGCGACARFCPTGNITIVDSMPVWGDDCQQCLGCIHRCPKKAIEYGKSTKDHGRYVFKFSEQEIYDNLPTE